MVWSRAVGWLAVGLLLGSCSLIADIPGMAERDVSDAADIDGGPDGDAVPDADVEDVVEDPADNDAAEADAVADADAGGDADADADPDGDVDVEADGDAGRWCGNGIAEPGEECDDGNGVDGDGCDSDCTFSCRDAAECDDGNPCTDDGCADHVCSNTARSGCCVRDAECMSPGRPWECDPGTHTCYDPPAGEVCAPCSSRRDCGDGGEASDDWCAFYDASSHGCTKDCIDGADCPGGTYCSVDGVRPCTAVDAGCFCWVRTGNCNVFNSFGASCATDANCRTCGGCDMMLCPAGYCTWLCGGDEDCRWGTRCESGYCQP